MSVKEEIKAYIASQPEQKQADMQALHQRICKLLPKAKLWFDNGKNAENKTVSNPTIGYGFQTLQYADGKTRDFFQIGISANTSGISVYILGLKDKTYLAKTYAATLGKAKITGYCIKFKGLKDVNIDTLEAAIRYGVEA